MAAIDVLPLDVAKRYLNERTGQNDTEITEDFIPPAVARVERHLGRELGPYETVEPLERLALQVCLAEYWRTQRVSAGRSYGGGGGGASGAAIELDSDPAGAAPLKVKLTELLGEEAPQAQAAASSPQGSFPPPAPWPDPADRRRWS